MLNMLHVEAIGKMGSTRANEWFFVRAYGKINLTLQTIARLTYALNVDVVELFKPGTTTKPTIRRGRPKLRRAKSKANTN